jgi:hypothetical protein
VPDGQDRLDYPKEIAYFVKDYLFSVRKEGKYDVLL